MRSGLNHIASLAGRDLARPLHAGAAHGLASPHIEDGMARSTLRSITPALAAAAALAALTAASAPAARAAAGEPAAEAWRIVCTMDGVEVLRREPVYRIWHDGERPADEAAAA